MSEVKNNIRYVARWLIPHPNGKLDDCMENAYPSINSIPTKGSVSTVGYHLFKQTNPIKSETRIFTGYQPSKAEKEEFLGRFLTPPLLLDNRESGEAVAVMRQITPQLAMPNHYDRISEELALSRYKSYVEKFPSAEKKEEIISRLGKKPSERLSDNERLTKFDEIEVPLLAEDKVIIDGSFRHLGVNSGIYDAKTYVDEIYPKIKDTLLKEKTAGIAI